MRDIILPSRLPWPANWEVIFGRSAPLVIEIGFGNGDFLVDLARKRPHHNILGLEIALPSLKKAERKIERFGLSNVRVIQGLAHTTLWTLCTAGTVAAMYINFPDPWPKPGHHHRRLINDHFLHLAASRLAVNGEFYTATDDDEYAAWIQAVLGESPYFDNLFTADYLTEDNERLRTKYEQKAITDGRTCFYFKRFRNKTAVTYIFPIPKELPMPHAIIKSPISIDEISQQFEPVSWSSENANVRLNELYNSTFHQALLVDSYIKEEPLEQRIMLAITRRKEGDYLIHLHEVGFPRPTTGIHFAVYRLAQWLASLDPPGIISSYKLSPDIFEGPTEWNSI